MAIDQQQSIKSSSQLDDTPPPIQRTLYSNTFIQISKFHEQKGKITSSIILSFRFILPIIILLKDLPNQQEDALIPFLRQMAQQYLTLIYTLIIFNKLLIVGTIVALYYQATSPNAVVMEVIRMFKPKLRGFVQVDYHISMSIMSIEMVYNIPNFIFSILIYFFACLYLQNYISKQDFFYCSSCRINFINRIFLTVGYLITAFLFTDTNNEISLKVAVSIYIIAMTWWFYKYQHHLYPNEIVCKGMMGFMSLLITSNLLIVEKQLSGGSHTVQGFIIRNVISFVTIFIASTLIIDKKIEEIHWKENYHISEIKGILNDLFINQSKVDKAAFLCGRIQIHREKCLNVQCQLHSFDLYNQKILLNSQYWGICSILKSYFRCLYQSHLGNKDKDSGQLLEYLQYLFSQKNPNPYKMALNLCQIDSNYIDIFDKSSLFDLRRKVERLFKIKMGDLYQGKLHFEQTLQFDQHCKEIEKSISYLIKSNMQIYKHLQQNQIDLNVVFQRIRDNLIIQKTLNKQWLKISKNLKYQKLITITYFYYKQLIKNERITRKDMLLMNLQQSTSAEQQSIFLKQANYFDPSILFHKETIIFTCTLVKQRLLFKDVNYNFEYYLKYNRDELTQSSLDQIFGDQLKKVHQLAFDSWMNCNIKSSFQRACYQFKKTQCMTKEGIIIPVLKYFKAYINSTSQLEFVCMLKINKTVTVNNSLGTCVYSKNRSQAIQEQKPSLTFCKNPHISQFSNDEAIFIKQKQFEPNANSKDILNMKIIISIFFVLTSASLIAFHMITIEDALKLKDNSQQYITFMQCYRIPMILGNNYLQSIMGIGNQTKIANQINQLSLTFANLTSNPVVLQTIYDGDINLHNRYYPYQSGKIVLNELLSYDQIQIFYLISASITSLRSPIDPKSQDFINFDQFITPAYDDMLNNTKHKFHESFISYINYIIRSELVIQIIQFSLAAVFILIIIYRIQTFMKKMKLISDAIVYFKKQDLETILHYWMKIHDIFGQVFGKYTHTHIKKKCKTIKQKQEKSRIQNQEQYLNRINKIIIQSNHFKNFNKIAIFMIVLGTFIMVASFSGTQFSRISKLKYLIYFQNEGYLFLRYFPTATIVGYGCLSKYRSLLHPQITFNPSRYDTVLQAMKLVGKFDYIPSVKDNDSLYFLKQRNYFFGNPCTYNPSVINNIGVNISTCQTIIKGSFTRGLTGYMRDGSKEADDYMNGAINLNASQLAEFSQSVSVLSAYILDAISTWGTQFNSNLSTLISQQTIFTLVNFIVTLLVFSIIFSYFFVSFLQNQYEFYRYMYLKMIPQYILRSDKVAKQTFINFNILE